MSAPQDFVDMTVRIPKETYKRFLMVRVDDNSTSDEGYLRTLIAKRLDQYARRTRRGKIDNLGPALWEVLYNNLPDGWNMESSGNDFEITVNDQIFHFTIKKFDDVTGEYKVSDGLIDVDDKVICGVTSPESGVFCRRAPHTRGAHLGFDPQPTVVRWLDASDA